MDNSYKKIDMGVDGKEEVLQNLTAVNNRVEQDEPKKQQFPPWGRNNFKPRPDYVDIGASMGFGILIKTNKSGHGRTTSECQSSRKATK